MIKIDLHTHTYRSGDSTTSLADFADGVRTVDLVAVTDHHDIAAADMLRREFGLATIRGEEVNTGQGELIGLYLVTAVPRLLGLVETCRRIRAQGGLVYVPHPTDHTRHAIGLARLHMLCEANLVDVIEVGNSKSLTLAEQAIDLAGAFNVPIVAASDAHVAHAIGSSYTTISRIPKEANDLLSLLATSQYHHQRFDPTRDTSMTQVLPGARCPIPDCGQ
jgi:predicted metal-dependent phosphoesterase TrpH